MLTLEQGPSAQLRPPMIGDPAPNFFARTTLGERSIQFFEGRWLVFFSHPADFTPVCTSELIDFANASSAFEAINCDLMALSVDSLFAHLAWIRSLETDFGVNINFPIVEDASMTVARAYGMIHSASSDTTTVRATYVIDPVGIIRAILWYPLTTGRNIDEILRLVKALQLNTEIDMPTPAGWREGDDVLVPAPLTANEMRKSANGAVWYFRKAKQNSGKKK